MKRKITLVALLLGFVLSANAQKRIEITELPIAAQDFLQKYFSYTSVISPRKMRNMVKKAMKSSLKMVLR